MNVVIKDDLLWKSLEQIRTCAISVYDKTNYPAMGSCSGHFVLPGELWTALSLRTVKAIRFFAKLRCTLKFQKSTNKNGKNEASTNFWTLLVRTTECCTFGQTRHSHHNSFKDWPRTTRCHCFCKQCQVNIATWNVINPRQSCCFSHYKMHYIMQLWPLMTL